MPATVQKISISIPSVSLHLVDRLKKNFKLRSRSAVFDYLLHEKEKKIFYEKVHQEAKILASDPSYQKKASTFAKAVGKNFTRFMTPDGENYSTW